MALLELLLPRYGIHWVLIMYSLKQWLLLNMTGVRRFDQFQLLYRLSYAILGWLFYLTACALLIIFILP